MCDNGHGRDSGIAMHLPLYPFPIQCRRGSVRNGKLQIARRNTYFINALLPPPIPRVEPCGLVILAKHRQTSATFSFTAFPHFLYMPPQQQHTRASVCRYIYSRVLSESTSPFDFFFVATKVREKKTNETREAMSIVISLSNI